MESGKVCLAQMWNDDVNMMLYIYSEVEFDVERCIEISPIIDVGMKLWNNTILIMDTEWNYNYVIERTELSKYPCIH